MFNFSQTAIFPLILPLHIIFAAFAVFYVGVRYIKYRKAYQLTIILAVLSTFLFRFTSSSSEKTADIICTIGVIAEVILYVLTIIFGVKAFLDSRKELKQTKAVSIGECSDEDQNS